MSKIRRIASVAAVTLVGTAFIAGPAGAADKPEAYLGSAAGRALNLSALGTTLTLGDATSDIVNGLGGVFAKSQGAGQLIALGDTVVSSEAKGAKTSDVKGEKCAGLALPAPISSIISIATACGSSSSELVNGLPQAKSSGRIAGVDLSANTVLETLGLNTVVGPLLDSVLSPFVGTPLDPVTTTVEDLIGSILNTKTLEVEVGQTHSSVATTAQSVTSKADAVGAKVGLLPLPLLNGTVSSEPVLTIEVGAASTSATFDRVTGKPGAATFDPALVRVKVNTVLTDALGFDNKPLLELAPGIDQTLLAGTPLESTIKVGAGSVKNITLPDGTPAVQAIADGVTLHLLKGLNGGIKLELAHAESLAGGVPLIKDKVLADVPRVQRELPRTGGTPWIPMAGAGAIALAVITRRTVLARVRPTR